MTKFTFTAPDGTKHTRNSKTRTYTHAIFHRNSHTGMKWRLGSCVGRPDLVAYRLEYWGRGDHENVVAVEADK